jgi:hypothetical protein
MLLVLKPNPGDVEQLAAANIHVAACNSTSCCKLLFYKHLGQAPNSLLPGRKGKIALSTGFPYQIRRDRD